MERWGKSPPLPRRRGRLCKPHPEQDQKEQAGIVILSGIAIGASQPGRGRPAPLLVRSLERVGNAAPRQMAAKYRTRLIGLLGLLNNI